MKYNILYGGYKFIISSVEKLSKVYKIIRYVIACLFTNRRRTGIILL